MLCEFLVCFFFRLQRASTPQVLLPFRLLRRPGPAEGTARADGETASATPSPSARLLLSCFARSMLDLSRSHIRRVCSCRADE